MSVGRASWGGGTTSLSSGKTQSFRNTNNIKPLQKAIFNQMARSHVVVIPSGMYATYSKWIQ
jgi:hypothetical protein